VCDWVDRVRLEWLYRDGTRVYVSICAVATKKERELSSFIGGLASRAVHSVFVSSPKRNNNTSSGNKT